MPHIKDAGMHVSYAMSVAGIVRKLLSAAHQENNTVLSSDPSWYECFQVT